MYDDDDGEHWKYSPRITGLILIGILLSPLGSPMLFWWMVNTCPNPIETGRQCFVPDGVSLYLAYFTIVPFFAFGYFGFVWWAMSFVSVITSGWFFVRASWCRVVPS